MVYDPKAAKEQAFYQGLLGLAAPLLAAGTRGPSTTPGGGGFGSALGQGLLGFQQGQQGYQQNAMRQGLLGMQMEQAQREEDRRKQYASLFQAPTGAQVLSANPGGPTMANAQRMANPPVNPMLAGLSPQQIAMMKAAEPSEGFRMMSEFQKQAMAPPPVQEFYDPQTGQPYKAQFSGGKWERVGGAKTALPTGMRMGMNGQPEFIPEYLAGQKQIRESGRPNVQTTVALPNNNDPFIKIDMDGWSKKAESLAPLAQIMPQLNTTLDILMNTNVETGKFQEMTMPIKSFIASTFGKEIPGLNEQQTLESQFAYLTPRMRVAGAGSSSDKDVAMYQKSVGSLGNTTVGNYITAWTMRQGLRNSEDLLTREREMIGRGISYSDRMSQLREMDKGIYAKPADASQAESLPMGTVYIHPATKDLRVRGWNERGR